MHICTQMDNETINEIIKKTKKHKVSAIISGSFYLCVCDHTHIHAPCNAKLFADLKQFTVDAEISAHTNANVSVSLVREVRVQTLIKTHTLYTAKTDITCTADFNVASHTHTHTHTH